MSPDDVSALQSAYLLYRSQTHALALLNGGTSVRADLFINERRQVREIWRKTFS